MLKRFPNNIRSLELFKNLQFKNIKNKNRFDSVYEILKTCMDDKVALSTYENQWNKLSHIDWQKLTKDSLSKNIFGFWALVYTEKSISTKTIH